jgi:glycosyltransferase involved in cell wall biosynthesis
MTEALNDRLDMHFIFPGDGICTDAYRKAGLHVSVIKAQGNLLDFGQHMVHMPALKKLKMLVLEVLPYSRKIWRYMKENDIKVIHANTTRSLLMGAIVPKFNRARIVWHVRGELSNVGWFNRKIAERLANSIVLVAKSLTTTISHAVRHKSEAIYNFVNDEFTDFAYTGDSAEKTGLEFGIFAAVIPEKGHHHLLDAVSILRDHNLLANVRFHILGDFMERGYEEFVKTKSNHINEVVFHGWVEDPRYWFNRVDCVILPSILKEDFHLNGTVRHLATGEGLPRTILEAMAFGKPVIATKIAGTPEQVLEGETGFIVDPSDPKAMAKAIESFILMDSSQRVEMGKRANDFLSKRFSKKDQSEKFYKLIVKLDE